MIPKPNLTSDIQRALTCAKGSSRSRNDNKENITSQDGSMHNKSKCWTILHLCGISASKFKLGNQLNFKNANSSYYSRNSKPKYN